MSGHTPGPWTQSEIASTTVDDASHFIVDCRVIDDDIETAIANARLIAAAPELLDLHKKHMELMMEIAQELKNPRMPIGQTVEASIRMLALAAKESLDAIAKATGEIP